MAVGITRIAVTVCLTVVGAYALAAPPSAASPDIGAARARVARLYHQAEQASERYDRSREQLGRASRRLAVARADLRHAQATVRRLRQQLAAAVVAQYQGQALSSVQLLFSRDPDTFLTGLAAVSQMNHQRSEMAAAFVVRSRQLDLRRQAARRVRDQMARTEHRMAAEAATIHARLQAARGLLSRLKKKAAAEAAARAARQAARQAARRRRASRSATRAPLNPAPASSSAPSSASSSTPKHRRAARPAPAGVSGRAGTAVRYALEHVGDAYVYGASGPTAFDCSGLTMMAWRAAGVSLPHNAAEQMGYGTPVARSQLRPGDLVFYYSPVSHVGIYIGHGRIVNAENPSVGVVVAPVGLMPYAGAVRIG